MGEVKRIFNQAKIDRDVDARMLPPGSYRDALNVNVGESEGGDVGAVENLKGNEEIAGQTTIVGTTIGSVRDPNNDKIYWFNKGTTTDAIYEYDETTGNVSPILVDEVGREKIKPQCAPELRPFLDLTPDDPNMRPSINIVFTPPIGGCTSASAFNYNAAAEFDNGTCIARVYGCQDPSALNYVAGANTATACTYAPPPPTNNITVSISGDGTFGDAASPVTLTATAGTATGTVSFLWSTGETTSTISVSGAGATIAGSVTATDDNGSATDTYSVTFSTAPIVTWSLSASTAGGVTNSSVSGGIGGEQGIQGTAEGISFQSTISPSSGFQWSGTAPTFTISGLPAGVTAGAVVGGTSGTNAASVTVSGTWNPTANVAITVTWTGGGIEAIPVLNTIISFGSDTQISTITPQIGPNVGIISFTAFHWGIIMTPVQIHNERKDYTAVLSIVVRRGSTVIYQDLNRLQGLGAMLVPPINVRNSQVTQGVAVTRPVGENTSTGNTGFYRNGDVATLTVHSVTEDYPRITDNSPGGTTTSSLTVSGLTN